MPSSGVRSPRLLFLTCHFPPVRTTACIRTWNIAKQLSRLGWKVTVVSPDYSLYRYADNTQKVNENIEQERIQRIQTDHRWRWLASSDLKCWERGLGWFLGGVSRRIANYLDIDIGIGWLDPAEEACSELTANDVDVILASGPSFSSFHLAKRLSERLDRPYVLDYRDPWTGNPHSDKPSRKATLKKEAKLLSGSGAVTIVSQSWGKALDQRFQLGSKLHVVTNGYDPEELENVTPLNYGHFSIVYAGFFYPPKRVISPIMAALRHLQETQNGKGPEWFFHYFGGHEDHVREEARRFGLSERVILHGMVSREEALSALRGASVAVVITSVNQNAMIEDKGIVTGKIFEMVGLGIPVLLIAPSGSDVETIANTTGLTQVLAGDEISKQALFLSEAMEGRFPEKKNVQAYAWTNIGQQLDEILRGIMAKTKTRDDIGKEKEHNARC